MGRADRARPVSAHTDPQPGANLALALDVHTNQLLEGIDHFLLLAVNGRYPTIASMR